MTSQRRCCGVLLDEPRKALYISVRFSYEPRKPTKIAARLVIWLQNIEKCYCLVYLLGSRIGEMRIAHKIVVEKLEGKRI